MSSYSCFVTSSRSCAARSGGRSFVAATGPCLPLPLVICRRLLGSHSLSVEPFPAKPVTPLVHVRDQILHEQDRKGNDCDQELSGRDQSASDHDEEALADDQALLDRELVEGPDPAAHELHRQTRARTSAERRVTSQARDATAADRAQVADKRDQIADERDEIAASRDFIAAGRERSARAAHAANLANQPPPLSLVADLEADVIHARAAAESDREQAEARALGGFLPPR